MKASGSIYYRGIKQLPRPKHDDVLKLYDFVRIVSQYVNSSPADSITLRVLSRRWRNIKRSRRFGSMRPIDDSPGERALSHICYLTHRFEFDPAWVDAYWAAKIADANGTTYSNLEDVQQYLYGSAEVLGLMLMRILDLSEQAAETIRLQARAWQYLSFLTDMHQHQLNHCQYFPAADIKRFGLKAVSAQEAYRKPAEWREFVDFQLKRYEQWQQQATNGYGGLPRYLRRIAKLIVRYQTASVKQLRSRPQQMFDGRLRPGWWQRRWIF